MGSSWSLVEIASLPGTYSDGKKGAHRYKNDPRVPKQSILEGGANGRADALLSVRADLRWKGLNRKEMLEPSKPPQFCGSSGFCGTVTDGAVD